MKIIYWSGTGNTEQMANAIAKGVNEVTNSNIDVLNVSDVQPDIVDNENLLILGCPAMGDEVLEEGEFEPFMESIEGKISGKKVALFGSYGWGDGEWMRNWEDRITNLGGNLVCDGLICQNEADENLCVEFGRKIAKDGL